MASKLKCPFCQTELDYDEYGWDYSCSNHSCQKSLGILSGTENLWQALTQAKQDLGIARNALKDIAFCKQFDSVIAVRKYADKALEQIEHKE